MRTGRQKLIDATVAVVITLVLVPLVMAGIARSRQAAQAMRCSEQLLHIGRLLQDYTRANHGFIPPSAAREYGDPKGRRGWYTYADALIESNLGISPIAPALATPARRAKISQEYLQWFRCPAAKRPVKNAFGTTYACNPNAFWRLDGLLHARAASGNNGSILDRMRDIPRPGEIIAIGDANQDADGNSRSAFNWRRYGLLDDAFNPTRFIPIGGPGGLGNKDGMTKIAAGDSGLRYRHVCNLPGTASAGVLYFDGHVGQINAQSLRQMDVAASY